MYKVYHNGTPIFITNPAGARALGYITDKNTFVAPYVGKVKIIKNYLDKLDHSPNQRALVLFQEDVEQLWRDFQGCFKIIEAAGGYVLNQHDELLVFDRRGSWDMPKGKIDPGETPEQAAVREVMEETGLKNVDLGKFLLHTYHTYEQKDKRILKKTWWYHMRTTDTSVTPQTEEDILEIRWVTPKPWLDSGVTVYSNIRDVIEQGMTAG
ncbi:MAG: NUDIX hydrolase [Saprospiraceae bacterium]|nr:NUDIX hydrolase [Saprospiraceae bacterium]